MYYVIDNNNVMISANKEILETYNEYVQDLPENYEQDKYIIGEKEIEINVPDHESVNEEYADVSYDTKGDEVFEIKTREVQTQIGSHIEIVKIKTLIPNPNWENEQTDKERKRIANLHLTRGDVFEALILAKGVTKNTLREFIEKNEDFTDVVKALYLNRFDEALEFYRSHPAIDFIGQKLGISSTQMDRFFETNDWHALVTEENE